MIDKSLLTILVAVDTLKIQLCKKFYLNSSDVSQRFFLHHPQNSTNNKNAYRKYG